MTELFLGLVAAVTMYTDTGLTRCGLHTAEIDGPWVAVPARELGTTYQCGDLLLLRGVAADGALWSYMATVQDTGYLGDRCVVQPDGQCAPIWFDLPAEHAPFPGLSARLTEAINLSACAREWQENGWTDG